VILLSQWSEDHFLHHQNQFRKSLKLKEYEMTIKRNILVLCIRLERPAAFRITGVDDSANKKNQSIFFLNIKRGSLPLQARKTSFAIDANSSFVTSSNNSVNVRRSFII
jgi:hypothetical protein